MDVEILVMFKVIKNIILMKNSTKTRMTTSIKGKHKQTITLVECQNLISRTFISTSKFVMNLLQNC